MNKVAMYRAHLIFLPWAAYREPILFFFLYVIPVLPATHVTINSPPLGTASNNQQRIMVHALQTSAGAAPAAEGHRRAGGCRGAAQQLMRGAKELEVRGVAAP
jgi:hypothetical protein